MVIKNGGKRIYFLFIGQHLFFIRFLLTVRGIVLSSGRNIIIKPPLRAAFIFLGACMIFLICALPLGIKKKNDEIVLGMFHPFLQIQPIAGDPQKHINHWGFRGEEISKLKPAGTYRIFVLGGSTVFCGEVPFEKCHTRILEKLLRQHYPGRRIEVQNAGMDWYTSQHSLIQFLIKVQDFDPDLIVTWHGINDMLRSFSPNLYAHGPYKEDYSHFYGPLGRMMENYTQDKRPKGTSLFELVYGRLSDYWFSDFHGRTNLKSVPIEHWKSLPAFERNMSNLVSVVQSKGIDMIVASQPFLYRQDLTKKERKHLWFSSTFMTQDGMLPNLESLIAGMNQFNEKSKSIAARGNPPCHFIDLEKMVPKTMEYFTDDVHFTELGNKVIGDALSNLLIDLKVMDKKYS